MAAATPGAYGTTTGINITAFPTAEIYGLVIGITVFTFVVLLMRLYSRVFLVKWAGWDDATATLAFLFLVVLSVLTCIGITDSFENNTFNSRKLDVSLKIIYASQLAYVTSVYVTKVSIIIFLVRLSLFETIPKFIFWTFLVVQTSWYIAIALVLAFQCNYPYWDILTQKCVDTNAMWYVMGIINILLDCVLLAVPVYVFLRLPIATRQRWEVAGIFSVGGFVCVASALRLRYVIGKQHGDPRDLIYSAAVWSIAEAGTGVICACLPAFKSALRNLIPGNCFCADKYPEEEPPNGRLESELQRLDTERVNRAYSFARRGGEGVYPQGFVTGAQSGVYPLPAGEANSRTDVPRVEFSDDDSESRRRLRADSETFPFDL